MGKRRPSQPVDKFLAELHQQHPYLVALQRGDELLAGLDDMAQASYEYWQYVAENVDAGLSEQQLEELADWSMIALDHIPLPALLTLAINIGYCLGRVKDMIRDEYHERGCDG